MDHSKSSSRSGLEELVRHACRHCGQILFISESTQKQEFNFTYDDVLTYARDGCDLFASRIIAHNFKSFGTCELQCLRLHVEIVWDNDMPNSTFHFIRFSWLKDNELVFGRNEEDELEESPNELHVFATQGTLIYPNCRKVANCLMLDSSTSDYIKTRPLIKSPGSMASMRWVQHQLQYCKKRHKKCREQRSLTRPMPTRLIAVRTPGSIYVHLEKSGGGNTEPYVALSYCWGGGQENIMTTRANLLERLQNIPFKNLPQTIKDAIIVTRELKYKYLWVDALCIVQDDEEDRAQEVSKMSLVYSGASLTISATKTDNSEQGFLQERDLVRSYGTVFELPLQVNREQGGEACILLHENSVQNKRVENIDKRGWTLQEHKLACCLLRYGSN
jgi:Heterokaryon incompatibility protein (HET)